MANYYGQTRTNYFAVKDPKAFIDGVESWGDVEVITREKDGITLYGLMDRDPDGAGLQWSRFSDGEDVEDRDWIEFLASHLADGQVAVMIDIGSEKYRYFNGIAWAVNNKGETRRIDLGDIYALASELGESVTEASY